MTLRQEPYLLVSLAQVPYTGSGDTIAITLWVFALLVGSAAVPLAWRARHRATFAVARIAAHDHRERVCPAASDPMLAVLVLVTISQDIWVPESALQRIVDAAGGDPDRAKNILNLVLRVAEARHPVEFRNGRLSDETVERIFQAALACRG